MTNCCIVTCRASKNKNRPQLTLHRFPRNGEMRKKWLEAIKEHNINPRHKSWYICSLHFEESCFNRTLDVVRLREDSVPTIFPQMASKKSPVLYEKKSNNCDIDRASPVAIFLPLSEAEEVQKEQMASENTPVLCENKTINRNVARSSTGIQFPKQEIIPREVIILTEKNKKLIERCLKQRMAIKRINEKLRRRNRTIANLKNIIEDLQQKNQKEAIIIITDSEGSEELLKRQVQNST